jgi:hypothetical protein
VSICRYMGVNAFGTDQFLKYQIRNRIEHIKKDDQVRFLFCFPFNLCYVRLTPNHLFYVMDVAHPPRRRRRALYLGAAARVSVARCAHCGSVSLALARESRPVDRAPSHERHIRRPLDPVACIRLGRESGWGERHSEPRERIGELAGCSRMLLVVASRMGWDFGLLTIRFKFPVKRGRVGCGQREGEL